jgi:DNA-binding NtrC family response regulator
MTQGKAVRVLVVDDEPTIRQALSIALTRAGHEVVAVDSGEQAITLLRTQPFDQLVIDLRIPDARGDVVFELAASLQPHLRYATVFTTGDLSERAQELIRACGCPLLAKPFDLADLVDILQRQQPSRVQDASA